MNPLVKKKCIYANAFVMNGKRLSFYVRKGKNDPAFSRQQTRREKRRVVPW